MNPVEQMYVEWMKDTYINYMPVRDIEEKIAKREDYDRFTRYLDFIMLE